MMQNVKYHAEIRKWDIEQLLNALELNGLGDCSKAVRNLEIDGETFLNLTEGQLAFWRKYLNNVQVKRFWSIIQLARDRPKDFVGDVGNTLKPTPHQEIERVRSPIAHSLENMLGQKPAKPGSKPKPEVLPEYENNETLLEIHKPTYKKLPPKPQQQPNIRNTSAKEYFPMNSTENEKHFVHNRQPLPIPVEHEQQSQNPDMNATKHEVTKSNSFLHANNRALPSTPINDTNNLTPPSNQNDTTNRFYRVPSPGAPSRPLPSPGVPSRPLPSPGAPSRPLPSLPVPKVENTFPLPPSFVPLIPNLELEHDEEDYDEIVHYKTKPWYSEIDRKQANELLKGKPNGTFIARPSKQKNYECSLSVIYNYRIYNLAILKQDDKLVIGNQEFESVNEIIEFFMENTMVLNGDNNEDIVFTLRQI